MHEEDVEQLESSLSAKIGSSFRLRHNRDVVADLLNSKGSENTRVAYRKDLRDFFAYIAQINLQGLDIPGDLVYEFLHLTQVDALQLVGDYKVHLLHERKLTEATVNRRLAAVKALVAQGRKAGMCAYNLSEIKSEQVEIYRDTTGVEPQTYQKLLAVCDLTTDLGVRDYGILRTLWDNALRRNELRLLDLEDFDVDRPALNILGKGKGKRKKWMDTSLQVRDALVAWLEVRAKIKTGHGALFVALDFQHRGHRLSGDGIYKLVKRYQKKAGVKKLISPHRIRHSAITAALEASGGNVRDVQKLSRHAKVETLMTYDDNRNQAQRRIIDLVADLIE